MDLTHTPHSPAKIAWLHDFPTEDECNFRCALTGNRGQYTRHLLKRANINPNEIYLAFLCNDHAPQNNYWLLPEADRQRDNTQLLLNLTKWRDLGLTTIISTDPITTQFLTGIPIKKYHLYRGSFVPCTKVGGLKVIVAYEAGWILRNNSRDDLVTYVDYQKAEKLCHTADLCHPTREVHIIRDKAEAIAFLESITNSDLLVATDIETRGGLLTAIGFAATADEAYVLTKELCAMPDVIRAVGRFAKSSTVKIFHNAGYDCLHGFYYYKLLWKNYHDTMLMQHAAMPTLKKSLAFCSSIYTIEPYWKDEGKSGKAGTIVDDNFYIYNGKDACVTREIYDALLIHLARFEAYPTYEFSLKLLEPAIFAMSHGTIVDFEPVQKFKEINERAIANLMRIKDASIGAVNVGSSQQLCGLVYEQWGFPKQWKTTITKQGKKKSLCADAKKLQYLATLPTPYAMHLELIALLKKHIKMRDFYRIKVSDDGRVRTSLKVHGAYTGRWSSSGSIMGTGGNLLNQPKKIRHFYVPDPGKIFIQMDLSQAEARCVAALCKDLQWLSDFEEKDLHTWVASQLFNIPMEQVKKKPHRDTAKKVAHGTHYLLGVKLLSEILKCSANEAKAHKEAYFKVRPSLLTWHENVKQTIKKQHYLRNPYGRIIQFIGPITDSTIREAVAGEPQSISAEYLNTGLLKIYEANIPSWEFHLQVYDSILCAVDDDIEVIKHTIKTMKELVEVELDIHGISLTIPADFEMGYSWGTLMEIPHIDRVDEVYSLLQKDRLLQTT